MHRYKTFYGKMTYTIEKVTTLIGAHRFGATDANIGFLLTDSRSLCFAEETLFFALKSGRGDGHAYIPDLYRRGVRNFVVEDVPADYDTAYPDANFLKVESSLVPFSDLPSAIVRSMTSPSWASLAQTERPS